MQTTLFPSVAFISSPLGTRLQTTMQKASKWHVDCSTIQQFSLPSYQFHTEEGQSHWSMMAVKMIYCMGLCVAAPCLVLRDFSEMRTVLSSGILEQYLYLSFVAVTVAEIK